MGARFYTRSRSIDQTSLLPPSAGDSQQGEGVKDECWWCERDDFEEMYELMEANKAVAPGFLSDAPKKPKFVGLPAPRLHFYHSQYENSMLVLNKSMLLFSWLNNRIFAINVDLHNPCRIICWNLTGRAIS